MDKFPSIIRDLLASGMTQVEIAASIGCSQGYISDLLNGRRGLSIGFALGSKLIELHEQRCKQAA